MEAVALYDVEEAKQAENIIERILPRLSHNNPAVILAAVKVIMKSLDKIKDKDLKQ